MFLLTLAAMSHAAQYFDLPIEAAYTESESFDAKIGMLTDSNAYIRIKVASIRQDIKVIPNTDMNVIAFP